MTEEVKTGIMALLTTRSSELWDYNKLAAALNVSVDEIATACEELQEEGVIERRDPYEAAERDSRLPGLQQYLDRFAHDHGISQDFQDASAHPHTCRCDKCLAWWCDMGPEDEDQFGPFTAQEVEAYCRKTGREIWWK